MAVDSDFIRRSLLILGALIALLGAGILFFSRILFLGCVPPRLFLQRDGFPFFFPVVTCVVLGLVLKVTENIVVRLFRLRAVERRSAPPIHALRSP